MTLQNPKSYKIRLVGSKMEALKAWYAEFLFECGVLEMIIGLLSAVFRTFRISAVFGVNIRVDLGPYCFVLIHTLLTKIEASGMTCHFRSRLTLVVVPGTVVVAGRIDKGRYIILLPLYFVRCIFCLQNGC